MQERVYQFIKETQLLEKKGRVGVGVSGGPDSMALLHFLKKYESALQIDVFAITVDHNLREKTSHLDSQHVAQFCASRAIPYECVKVDVKAYKKRHRVSTQMASRAVRYEAFKKIIEKENLTYLALGHHADDQIETMLMAMIRQTQSAALSGIPLKRNLGQAELIRPFLIARKEEIITYCEEEGIKTRFDESNDDLAYDRNYLRKKIMPEIYTYNPNIAETSFHLSQRLQDDERYLMGEAKKVFDQNVRKDGTVLSINIEKMKSTPSSLQRRVYQLILNYLYEEKPSSLSYIHETYFQALLKSKSNKMYQLPKGLIMERSYEQLIFYIKNEQKKESYHLTIPGRTQLSSGSIEAEFVEEKQLTKDPFEYFIAASSIQFPLKIRYRKKGDRMTWSGLEGSKKIKDLLIDQKVPRHLRDEVLVLVDANETVLWLIGYQKGIVKGSQNDSKYIRLKYT